MSSWIGNPSRLVDVLPGRVDDLNVAGYPVRLDVWLPHIDLQINVGHRADAPAGHTCPEGSPSQFADAVCELMLDRANAQHGS
jgi:hypothetical protein